MGKKRGNQIALVGKSEGWVATARRGIIRELIRWLREVGRVVGDSQITFDYVLRPEYATQ